MGANLPPTAFLAQLTLPLVFHSSVTLAKIASPPSPSCRAFLRFGESSVAEIQVIVNVKLSNDIVYMRKHCFFLILKVNYATTSV